MLPREPDDVWVDDDAYEVTDPKHSGFADMAADRADMERKRMKEDTDYAEWIREQEKQEK